MSPLELQNIPNFPEFEKKWLKEWEKTNLYQKYREKNNSSLKRFSFIDGPITANNYMGVHHGWGRTYKDLWQKFHNLLGFKQRFQNGFDCQGLWVEVEVEKELKLKTKKDIENLVPHNQYASIAKFVELCKERVRKFSQIQSEQSQRLGYFMDWNNSYYTMSDENNYMIWHFLKVCHEKGWIYKGKDSVPWCPRCQTAISQHEMLTEDYKEVSHESIILKFKIRNPKSEIRNEYLLVWTTTPWTIPANIAVAVDEKLDYALVEDEKQNKYWLAKDTAERIFNAQKKYKIIKVVKGKKLVGLKYTAPFDNLAAVQKAAAENPQTFHTVVATDPLILPILTSEGTGLVHTAVSAGSEDFKLGKKYNLPMIPVIDDEANYLPGLGEFSGKNAKKHPEIILDFLKKNAEFVFEIFPFTHRYPACWRCKTELVWKVTDQWYIGMDRPEKIQNSNPQNSKQVQSSKFKTEKKKEMTFRQKMIKVAKQITWRPDFGLERELDWLKNMHDWLISKPNRYWGLALPIYECKTCKTVTVVGSREELKDKAVAGWEKFSGHSPHKPYIDNVQIQCPHCKTKVSRIPDVGNVWLDAGIVPFSTLVDPQSKKLSYTTNQKYFREWFPADVITESFPGQFKNWFYSLIAMSTALENKPPFKQVLGYASCLGEDGRPMHKSWGNMIEFNQAADQVGADVMRWLYCRQDPTKNLLFGFKMLDEVKRQFHLPLWNCLKFFLTYSALDSLDLSHLSNLGKLNVLDQWILSRLKETEIIVKENIAMLQPNIAALAIENLVGDLSLWYVRQSRSRVWNNSTNTQDKLNFYQTFYLVLNNLTIMLSVFLPFFAEEIFSLLGHSKSVHLENWPELPNNYLQPPLSADMLLIRTITEQLHSQRKAAAIKVRQPLEKATISIDKKTLKLLKNLPFYEKIIASELNIKQVFWNYQEKTELSAKLDLKISKDLHEEGRVREIIRTVQKLRKEQNCQIDEPVEIIIPQVDNKYLPVIKEKTLSRKISFSSSKQITIKRVQ